MTDTVAVLSDVHGVVPALTAVLAEPDVRAAGRIVLAGDIAAGPQPVRTLDLLLSLGDRVVWIGGNCERELVSAARGEAVAEPISAWAGAQLRADLVELLDSLPKTVRLDVRGARRGPVLPRDPARRRGVRPRRQPARAVGRDARRCTGHDRVRTHPHALRPARGPAHD